MSERIVKELQEAGITVNDRPLEEFASVLFQAGYAYARAHGLSPKEAYQIAMEGLE